ncbi:MAG: PAS domain S-box protein, partial [Acidimicrobiia bacterium]|nr:PAS domain S-box protein [Acidimicrobiia bacterium]
MDSANPRSSPAGPAVPNDEPARRPTTQRRRHVAALLAFAVFAASVGITGGVVAAIERDDRHREREGLDTSAEVAAAALASKMHEYEQRLFTVRGLYAASHHVSRAEYEAFVEALDLDSGAAAGPNIFFVRHVTAAEAPAYDAEALADGLGPISPSGARPAYFVADRSAPEALSAQAQSVDLAGFDERRRALEASRDSGTIAITPPITLVSDAALPVGDRPLAFAMYVPVYRSAGVPETVEARREQLLGWAGSALRAEGWLADVLADLPIGLTVQLWDASPDVAGNGGLATLAASASPSGPEVRASASRSLSLGGRSWQLTVQATSAFVADGGLQEAVVAVAGVLVGALLAALVWVQARAKANAYHLVDVTTATLRDRESRLRLLAQNTTDLVARQDAEGRFLYASPSWQSQLGWGRETLVGASLADFVHPDDWAEVESDMTAGRLLGATNSEFVARLRASNGAFRWYEARGRLVRDADGALVERQVSLRDITARQRAEAELVDSLEREREMVQLLRSASETKTNILSGVSHELRTPLTNVLGYVEMLAEGDAGPLAPEQQRMLLVVDRNTRRLLSLIDDLLAITQIESGRLNPAASPVCLDEVVEAARQSVDLQLDGRDLSLEVHACTPGLELLGDAEQLERVLVNLLTNAVKFTPDGGRVVVAVSRDEDEVVLSVTDTGIGIPFDEQPRLFERFFRSSVARARTIQGTGLGLAICKGIVEHH